MTNDELLDEIRKAHKPAPFAGLWLTNQQIDYLTRVAKKEAIDQAIRDCITAVEAQAKAGHGQAMPGSDWVHVASVLAALRALLDKP